MPGTSTILKGELKTMAGKKFTMSALLNEQSLVKEEGGTYEIRLIPLVDLIPSPDNNYSMEGIEELADSILQVGLLQNLYVKGPDENGKYVIISGHRRMEALKLNAEQGHAEWAKAPCHVDGCQDPLLNELKLLEANAQARVLTQADQAYQAKRRAEIYQELKDSGVPIRGRVRELVAKDMGVSPAQVSRYESINENLNEGLKEEFQAERIGVTDAYDLSTLPEEEQAQVLEEFKTTGELKNPKKEARQEAKRSTPEPAVDKPVQEQEEQAAPSPEKPSKKMQEAGMQAVSGMRDLAEKEESAPVAVDGQPEEDQAAPVAGDLPILPVQTKAKDIQGGKKIIVCPCCMKEFILTSEYGQ